MNKNNLSGFVDGLLKSRVSIIEALVIAIVFGVAVSLASNYIFSLFENRYGLMWIVIGLLIILALIYVVRGLTKNFLLRKKYTAACCIDKSKEKNFVDIVLYNFNSGIFDILKSLWRVDREERLKWCCTNIISNSSEVLFSPWQINIIKKGDLKKIKKNYINELIEMATEIVVLRAISDSFVKFYSNENTSVASKKLDLDSFKNIEQENVFIKKVFSLNENFYLNYKGDRKEAVNIVMPGDSKLYKRDGVLYLETSRLILKINFEFPGIKSYESEEFYLFYLKKEFLSVDFYKIHVYLSAEIKRNSIFDFGDWWEVSWLNYIDSEMERVLDYEGFKKRVNFDGLLASIFVMNNMRNISGGGK